ncbi:MAG: cytochrome c3 family protein, partial [Pseudomonadota bacterium]
MRLLLGALVGAVLLGVSAVPARADTLESMLMPGKVIAGHAKVEGECKKCHKQFDKSAQPELCVDCHKEVGKDVAAKTGFHGRQEEEKQCKECHTDHKGRDFVIVMLDEGKFDHDQTDFKLKGKHTDKQIKCKDCHNPKMKFREASSECNACHKKDDKHKGGLGPNCGKCHVEEDWKKVEFDHDKTKFALLGKHKDVKCKDCHAGEKFKDTPKLCNSCHKKDDKHKGNFGPKCESCHVEKEWKEIKFDHDKQTKYPLLGKHRDAKCSSCHKGDLYKDKLHTNCNSCHQKDDKHKGNFGPKCESCHVEKEWKEIKFDHDKQTKYPLLGKHR